MLKIGDPAPAFSLASDTGHIISSEALKGQRYVLYFYPKDDTPGCTKEACAFRDNLPAFSRLGVPVFGLSADDEKSHARFVRKYSLNFPLLSDPDHELLTAYGAWVEKSMYGRSYMGIQRSTFVVDGNGRIEQVWEKVSPETHAAEVHAYLSGGATPAKPKAPPVKKAPTKKTATKKVATKKVVTKKAPMGKAAAKKVSTRKTPAKKAAAANKSAKKAPAKKAAATSGARTRR